AVKNAQMAESPVLLIGGAAASLQKGRGALQDIDQLSLFKTLCKSCVSVRAVRDIVPTLRKAIATAQSGTPGPVFVELPIDVLYPFHVVEKEIGGTKSSRGLRGKAVQWYLQNYIRNLFAGAWEPRDMSPLPVKVPLATDDEVQQCVELVSRAVKPLVLVGSQAMLPPTPAEELRLGTGRGVNFGLFGGGSWPLSSLGGLPTPSFGGSQPISNWGGSPIPRPWGTSTHFQLGTPPPILWGIPPTFSLPGVVVGGVSPPNREKAATPTPQHLNPLDLLHRLDSLLPPESLLVADGGDFVGTAAYIVRPRRPLSWLDPGTVATEPPTVASWCLSPPWCQVWVLYGDGSLGYSLMEFDTFVRHKTPVIALVGNDACWSQISREQVALLGSNVACGLEYLGEHRPPPYCPQIWGHSGDPMSSSGGLSHAWWHHVTVGMIRPCLVASWHRGDNQAIPGGTVSPWGGLSWAGCHRVTLGRTRPGLVASHSFGDNHMVRSPPGTIGLCLQGLCHPWEDQATSSGNRSPLIRPRLVAPGHP
uniref:IlvB acetolactate synthase like n=1 Tax=Bubo bubo TaxID=30461 RepID=A0A8C0ECQ3_BUBBB